MNFGLLAFILAIYACRECDLHQASFLAEHVTRVRFYRLPSVPLWQKMFFASLIATTAIAILVFLARTLPAFFSGLKGKQAWALFGLLWFLALSTAQACDKSWLNETIVGQALEEILEGVAAAFAFLVVAHFPKTSA